MSYEGRVMSSEMTFKVILVVGNTHTRQRDSGYSVVSGKPCASRHRTGRLPWTLGTRILVNCMILGVCELALKPRIVQEDLCLENILVEPRPKPDSGNPTVRDCREACGNVNYGKS